MKKANKVAAGLKKTIPGTIRRANQKGVLKLVAANKRQEARRDREALKAIDGFSQADRERAVAIQRRGLFL